MLAFLVILKRRLAPYSISCASREGTLRRTSGGAPGTGVMSSIGGSPGPTGHTKHLGSSFIIPHSSHVVSLLEVGNSLSMTLHILACL